MKTPYQNIRKDNPKIYFKKEPNIVTRRGLSQDCKVGSILSLLWERVEKRDRGSSTETLLKPLCQVLLTKDT
jgi:hypothetical protein